jgi:hypothetical protein
MFNSSAKACSKNFLYLDSCSFLETRTKVNIFFQKSLYLHHTFLKALLIRHKKTNSNSIFFYLPNYLMSLITRITIVGSLLFFINYNIAHAQDRVKLDVGIGPSIPTATDVSSVYTAALNISAGPQIRVIKNKELYIQPVGGIKWYFKQISDQNSLTENFRTWKAGLEFLYRYSKKDISIFPLFRIDYNWCANYFSETYDYNIATNTSSTAVSDNYLSGNGLSYEIGVKIKKDQYYLKLGYEFFTPVLNVNPKVIQEGLNDGFIVAPQHPFNFNTINIGLGIFI